MIHLRLNDCCHINYTQNRFNSIEFDSCFSMMCCKPFQSFLGFSVKHVARCISLSVHICKSDRKGNSDTQKKVPSVSRRCSLPNAYVLSLSLSVHPSISLSLWRVFKASALDLEQTYCLLMKQTEH